MNVIYFKSILVVGNYPVIVREHNDDPALDVIDIYNADGTILEDKSIVMKADSSKDEIIKEVEIELNLV